MTRARMAVVGVVALWLVSLQPLLAVSPSYVMVYGGDLPGPILVDARPGDATVALWQHRYSVGQPDGDLLPRFRNGPRRPSDGDALERRQLAERLSDRPFLKFAVFWGRWDEPPASPEAASQHGRLYPATGSEPAVVVVTVAAMQGPGGTRAAARPIPADFENHRDAWGGPTGFVGAWTLSAEEVADLGSSLGLPGW